MRMKLLFGSAANVLAMAFGPATFAQTTSPAQADASPSAATSLSEVVVTATKRDTTIQKTPISITSITGKDLEARGITHLEDAIRDVPSVSIRSAGPGQTELEMRGLSSSGGSAPTVGFYLDDVPLTPPVGSQAGKTVIDPTLYDLARVEVLRGPQGTLYGGGSMGGTIRLITNQPQLNTFGGSISSDASGTAGGDTPNGSVNFALNVPLVQDKLAIRLVGTETYNTGWIDRIVLGDFPAPTNNGCAATSFYGCARGDVTSANVARRHHDVNWDHSDAIRGSILYQPVDNVKSTFTALYQTTRQGGSYTYDNPPGSNYLAHYEPADVKEPYYDQFWLVANTTKVDLSAFSINLATTYWKRYQVLNQDTAEAYQSYFGFTQFPKSGVYEVNPGTFPINHFSEEIRLSSNSRGRFTWIVGGFYQELKSTATSYTQDPNVCGLTVTTSVFTPVCASNNTSGVLFNSIQNYKVTQYAAFGEASYKILPDLTFTAGARYFDYTNLVKQAQNGYFAPTFSLTPTYTTAEQKNEGVTPKFNIAYEPSNQLTLYATAAEGFRPGGVNPGIPVSCNVPSEGYNPDTVWSYEGGEKWRSQDGKLVVNSDFYFNKWKNIQQLVTPPCGFGYTANAGNAETYGPEVELAYKMTPELLLEANGTYTHANITSAANDSSFAVGQRILNIPQYQAHIRLAYSKHILDDLRLTAMAEDTFVGDTEDISYTVITLPAYSIANLRLSLEKGAKTLTFYINNVGNTHAEISANNTGLTTNIPSLYRISTNQPLTGGVSLKYSF